jgi:hypothetical protein
VGESLCIGIPFPEIQSQAVASSIRAGVDITNNNLETPTYEWQMNIDDSGWPRTVVGTNPTLPQSSSREMGDGQNVKFRRKATIKGNIAYTNIVEFTFQPSVNTPGTIAYQDNKAVREGYELYSDILNVTGADVLEGPDSGSPIYSWTKENIDLQETTVIDGATSVTLPKGTLGLITEDVTIRRVSKNDFDGLAETNPINIKSIKAEGFIGGKITAPGGGAKIAGVSVSAELDPMFGDVIDRHYANGACDTTDTFGDYKIEGLYTGDPNGED